MKAKTQIWHVLVITLALLVTACGGSSGSVGGSSGSVDSNNGPINWDYSPCDISAFLEIEVPDNRIEENFYAGQSTTKEGTLGAYSLDAFQFSLQDSGTITVSYIGAEALLSFLISANNCRRLPLTGKVPRGPYYVSIANITKGVHEYSLIIDLE